MKRHNAVIIMRTIKPNEWSKLQLYAQLMNTQLSRFLAYAALFITMQGFGLYYATTVKIAREHPYIVWGLAFIITVILLGICYASGRNTDRWKEKIFQLIQSTDMEKDFDHWRRWPYSLYYKKGGLIRLVWMVPLFCVLGTAWYYVFQ